MLNNAHTHVNIRFTQCSWQDPHRFEGAATGLVSRTTFCQHGTHVIYLAARIEIVARNWKPSFFKVLLVEAKLKLVKFERETRENARDSKREQSPTSEAIKLTLDTDRDRPRDVSRDCPSDPDCDVAREVQSVRLKCDRFEGHKVILSTTTWITEAFCVTKRKSCL